MGKSQSRKRLERRGESFLVAPGKWAKLELSYLEYVIAVCIGHAMTDDEKDCLRQLRVAVEGCRRAVADGAAADAAGYMALANEAHHVLLLGVLKHIDRLPQRTGGKESGRARRAARQTEAKKIEKRVATLRADALCNGRSTRGLLRRACRERAQATLGDGASEQKILRATLANEALFRRSQDDES